MRLRNVRNSSAFVPQLPGHKGRMKGACFLWLTCRLSPQLLQFQEEDVARQSWLLEAATTFNDLGGHL